MDWHALSSKEVIEKLGSRESGLNKQKVEENRHGLHSALNS